MAASPFSISFPNSNIDGALNLLYIKSFSFVEDINKMYVGAKLILKDISNGLRNSLYLGQDVVFTFNVSELTYNNYMRILTILPVTENEEFVNELEITLISNWYFEQFAYSGVHKGSVSSIIKAICEKYKKDNIFNKYDILDSEDDSRIRYQTRERTQDFMKRIVPLGISQNQPLFLYSDCKGCLNLKGLSTFCSNSVKIVFLPDVVSDLEETSTKDITDRGMVLKRLNNYRTVISLNSCSSEEKDFFLTNNFIPVTSSSKLEISSEFSNAETSNSKIKITTPPSRRCWNWNYLPQDARALSSYTYFHSNLLAFSFTGIIGGDTIDYLNLGDRVRLFLPTDSTNISDILTSSSTPNYIITHIERKFINNQTITSLSGVLVNYG